MTIQLPVDLKFENSAANLVTATGFNFLSSSLNVAYMNP